MFRCLAVLVLFACVNANADDSWKEVPATEFPRYFDLAEASLDSQWQAAERGWCNVRVPSRSSELAVGWGGDAVCFQVRRDSQLEESTPPSPDAPLLVAVVTRDERWVFGRGSGILRGETANTNSPNHEWDARPRKFWLSLPTIPAQPYLPMLKNNRTHGGKVFRSETGHFKFESTGTIFEFDPEMRLVRVELQTKVDQLKKPELALPIRMDYEVATDEHGVPYCSRATMSVWRRGGGGSPHIKDLFVVTEYDSAPAESQLFLTYSALPIEHGTIVDSTIPDRPGLWLFGEEAAGDSKVLEKKLRDLGMKLREDGFSSRSRSEK